MNKKIAILVLTLMSTGAPVIHADGGNVFTRFTSAMRHALDGLFESKQQEAPQETLPTNFEIAGRGAYDLYKKFCDTYGITLKSGYIENFETFFLNPEDSSRYVPTGVNAYVNGVIDALEELEEPGTDDAKQKFNEDRAVLTLALYEFKNQLTVCQMQK